MAKDGKNGNAAEQPAAGHRNYNERRWMTPSKRAKGYAKDRKERVHTYGPKEGQELTEYENGIQEGAFRGQDGRGSKSNFEKERVSYAFCGKFSELSAHSELSEAPNKGA